MFFVYIDRFSRYFLLVNKFFVGCVFVNAVFRSWTFRWQPCAPALEVRKKLPKAPATTRVGNQDMGYSSDGQIFSVVGSAFRQVFSKFK